ncbi:MAG TPA: FAD-dependent oxidoreductase [Bryobacteraceae bacterium]|nr:FAD-dependent oxidoreductase [Bryobacteraceae bacterium]
MQANRRDFLRQSGGLLLLPGVLAGAREFRCEVAVIGGGTGGCAAALAALRDGMRVILTEETDWVGGQLTAQAVPPDEHQWIESFGCTRLFRTYRDAVRQYYRDHYPLTAVARGRRYLNPGDGGVSRLTHEPRVSLAVLESMLAPYLGGGQLVVLLRHKPVSADVDKDSVRSVTVKGVESGRERTVYAAYFVDATEQGDLLPLTRTEYVTGFESRKQTGEPHAPEQPQPANMQAFTVCFAVDHIEGEDHTIDKPDEYSFWRDYVPQLRPPWPGKLLSWSMSNPVTLELRPVMFDPELKAPAEQRLNLWLYRRIANRRNFAEGAYRSDISLINWPQNDYWLGNLHEVSEDEAAGHLLRGKQLSLSLLYWMQTEAPRPDGGHGFRGLRLRHDITGTEDGLAKYPYIRESRRIQAEFTVLEQHVGTDARMKLTGRKREELTAEVFGDSVGVGSYRIDLHPSSGGDNYIDVSSLPFQIPLGALIPKRVENLLPASKNLGVTHITNGCYRLHPVEWNIGESAGAVAAHAIHTKNPPRRIRNSEKLLKEFQTRIVEQGIEVEWPKLSPR